MVNYPDDQKRVKRGRHGGWVYVLEKRVDSVTLKVVAEIKGDECWIITAYEPG
jgi:hypothetical protein